MGGIDAGIRPPEMEVTVHGVSSFDHIEVVDRIDKDRDRHFR